MDEITEGLSKALHEARTDALCTMSPADFSIASAQHVHLRGCFHRHRSWLCLWSCRTVGTVPTSAGILASNPLSSSMSLCPPPVCAEPRHFVIGVLSAYDYECRGHRAENPQPRHSIRCNCRKSTARRPEPFARNAPTILCAFIQFPRRSSQRLRLDSRRSPQFVRHRCDIV